MNSTVIVRFSIPLLVLLGACGGGGSSTAITGTSPQAAEPIPRTVAEALSYGVNQGVDGMFAYVEEADGTVTTAAAGIQDKDSAQPADTSALFKVASISKQFIAVSASKLAYQRVLSMDDTLAFWLPELASRIDNSETITLRLLLQHRSGVPDFDTAAGFDWRDSSHTDIDATLGLVLDLPADFTPNAGYQYSNTNYLLLGKVLDRALGYSHRTFIQDFILSPLALNDTYNTQAETDASRLASGYWDDIDVTNWEYGIPGGSMVSTVKDIAVFIRALAKGDLLNNEERAIYRDVYWFSHSGWLPGYQSIANYERDLDAVVILFTNNTGGQSEEIAESTYNHIVSILR
jgi:D-alanyl-D-alanine carboxypeptidase